MSIFAYIKQHRAESFCFALFILLALFGFGTHEMWYDEAQAWQIARTAPFTDILFVLPHYEGHPPFWHLLLAIPAKLGLSWQWGVSIVGMLFMLVNGFLLFFKAPFPRWVRCLLPFNYFLFYQYGIIVRPYSAILLIMLLLAIYFPQKDKRPTLYIGLLAALCACHLFGIAIAGGITLAWIWELKAHRPWKEYICTLFKDGRFHRMLLLLGFVLVLFTLMHQADGRLDKYLAYTSSLFKQTLYLLFALPAEAVLTNLADQLQIMQASLPWANLLLTCTLGLLLWTLLFIFVPCKRLSYFVLPYLLLGAILLHYCSRHHIGIILILTIWYAWITLQEFPPCTQRPKGLKLFAQGVLALILIVPIGWSAYGLYLDYKLVLFPGKEVVAFLHNHHLEDKVIFAQWEIQTSDYQYFWADPHSFPTATILNTYLPYNIIDNFNNRSKQAYLLNTTTSPQETNRILTQWRSYGLPDVLLGLVVLPMLYDDPDIMKQYRTAFFANTYTLWKFNSPKKNSFNIYLRKDLWDELKDRALADFQAHNEK